MSRWTEGNSDALKHAPYFYNDKQEIYKVTGWNFYCSSMNCYGLETGYKGRIKGTIKKRVGVMLEIPKICIDCGYYLYVERIYN